MDELERQITHYRDEVVKQSQQIAELKARLVDLSYIGVLVDAINEHVTVDRGTATNIGSKAMDAIMAAVQIARGAAKSPAWESFVTTQLGLVFKKRLDAAEGQTARTRHTLHAEASLLATQKQEANAEIDSAIEICNRATFGQFRDLVPAVAELAADLQRARNTIEAKVNENRTLKDLVNRLRPADLEKALKDLEDTSAGFAVAAEMLVKIQKLVAEALHVLPNEGSPLELVKQLVQELEKKSDIIARLTDRLADKETAVSLMKGLRGAETDDFMMRLRPVVDRIVTSLRSTATRPGYTPEQNHLIQLIADALEEAVTQ